MKAKVIDTFYARRQAQLALELARRFDCGGDAQLRQDCRGDWWLTGMVETVPTPIGLQRELTCCPANLRDVRNFLNLHPFDDHEGV